MHIDELDYELPPELIAQRPSARRDESRMLIVDRSVPGPARSARIRDLPAQLRPDDCLVINDTRVIPARFGARRRTGGRVEGLYLESRATDRWTVLLKPSARLREGEQIDLDDADARLVLERASGPGQWEVRIDPPTPAPELLERVGWTPLPPYIKRHQRGPEDREFDGLDRARYQTIYAKHPGAVAAPTAGLHLTESLLNEIRATGVRVVPVTLHVGLGTFEPIKVERLEDHVMHAEWYDLPAGSARAIAECRDQGGRVVAVGTTSARVLESRVTSEGSLQAGRGMTDIFIYPPYVFRCVDGMLTNFHLPRSTLLAMVFALAGRERILAAYRQAIEQGFRFYSYGDAMLIV